MIVKKSSKIEVYPVFRLDLLCYDSNISCRSEPNQMKRKEKKKRELVNQIPDLSHEIRDLHICSLLKDSSEKSVSLSSESICFADDY